MDYIKLGTRYYRDPAILSANDRTRGLAEVLFLRALAQCGADETEGHVARSTLPFLGVRGAERVADVLVDEKLWELADGGWRVRSWSKWQAEHDALARRRKADRTRQSRRRSRDSGSDPSRDIEDPSREQSRDCLPTSARVRRGEEEEKDLRGQLDPPRSESDAREPNEGPKPTPAAEATMLGQLVSDVRVARPGWDEHAIADAARKARALRGASWPDIRDALLAVAALPDTTSPGRVVHDGPWWRGRPGDRPAVARPDSRPLAETIAAMPEADPERNARGRAAARAALAKPKPEPEES